MLPTSKGKVVSVNDMKVYGDLRNSSTHSELHYQRELVGWLYDLAFLYIGTVPQHVLKMRLGETHKQGKKSLLILLGIAPRLLNNQPNDLITTDYAYIITFKGNQIKS
jgi:hypothetical protein